MDAAQMKERLLREGLTLTRSRVFYEHQSIKFTEEQGERVWQQFLSQSRVVWKDEHIPNWRDIQTGPNTNSEDI